MKRIFLFLNKDSHDLEKTVYDIIDEINMEVDFRNCFVECDVILSI
ncbi:hypothetical protein [Tepidibacter formicigenes]|nr:hypothetical protein [Tepidibacter formicigenes]